MADQDNDGSDASREEAAAEFVRHFDLLGRKLADSIEREYAAQFRDVGSEGFAVILEATAVSLWDAAEVLRSRGVRQ